MTKFNHKLKTTEYAEKTDKLLAGSVIVFIVASAILGVLFVLTETNTLNNNISNVISFICKGAQTISLSLAFYSLGKRDAIKYLTSKK